MTEVRSFVIEEVEQKMKRLSFPKGYSIRPILIHVNGVSRGIIDSELFTQIVELFGFPKSIGLNNRY